MEDQPFLIRPKYKNYFSSRILPLSIALSIGNFLSIFFQREPDFIYLVFLFLMYLAVLTLISPIWYFLTTIGIRNDSISGPSGRFSIIEIPFIDVILPSLPNPLKMNMWSKPIHISSTSGKKIRLDLSFSEKEILEIVDLIRQKKEPSL